ncbi:MAG: thioesterase domain-containing protein [Xanthobacteraceae bacterium]|jgi:pimeloyl-ACP methyl ester carboxylesterase
MSDVCHPIAKTSFGLFRRAPPSGLRRAAASAMFAGLLALTSLAFVPAEAAQSAVRVARPAADVSRPHVYLMRGLLNIFSLGMDQLAAQIQRHGIDASVYNHSVEEAVVNQIAQQYRSGDHGPYILVGHSLGADAVMTMAQQLYSRDVPVALVVPFDGTNSFTAPANVACLLNVTQRRFAYMRPGVGFRGRLQNMDVSGDTTIDHFTIDKSPRLQAIAMNLVLQAAHSESCQPAMTGPAVARPREVPAAKEMPAKSASPGLRPGNEG